MKLSVGYPGRDDELSILEDEGGDSALSQLGPVVGPVELASLADMARRVHVAPTLAGYLLDLASATRQHRALALGMSPRAVLGLQRVIRVRAASLGRGYATADDVKAVAAVVLGHRLIVSPEAQIQGVAAVDVLDEVLSTTPVPREAPVP
jgi:MoxR-like ATPase